MTPTLSRIAVLACASVLSLLIAEGSVRLAVPKYDPASHVSFVRNPVAGVTLGKPDTTARQIKNSGDYDVRIAFNRHGLRDRRDISKGSEQDLYVVGDSFSFGWGVEENHRFSDVLEQLTGRRVYNVASTANVDGYEKLLAYAEGRGAKIRDIILAINMIDDVRDYGAVPEARPIGPGPAPGPDGGRITLQSVKELLLHNSALYFLTTSTLGSFEWLRRTLIRAGLIKTIKSVSGGMPTAGAIRSTAARIEAMSKKYNLTVLVIPSRGLWIGNRRNESAAAHGKFVDSLRRLNLHIIDLRQPMEASRDPLQYHFRNDGHWVPKGHALAARELARALKTPRPGMR